MLRERLIVRSLASCRLLWLAGRCWKVTPTTLPFTASVLRVALLVDDIAALVAAQHTVDATLNSAHCGAPWIMRITSGSASATGAPAARALPSATLACGGSVSTAAAIS